MPDSQPLHELATDYYNKKPNFASSISKPVPAEDDLPEATEDLKLNENTRPTGYEAFQYTSEEFLKARKQAKMPAHPAEENTSGSITDQVAKDSSDSNASSHQLHQGDTGATSGGSVSANAHKANPGPVQVQDIGEPASRDELKKRSEELNKK